MPMNAIQQLVDSMDPNEAAQQSAETARKLFSVLGEEALRDFLAKLSEGEGREKTLGTGALLTGHMRGRRCRSNSNVSQFGGKNHAIRATHVRRGPGAAYTI